MSNRYSFSLIASVLLLFAVGVIMVYNTTAAEVLDRSLDINIRHAFYKQLIIAFIATLCAVSVFFLGYENILRLSGLLLFFTTVFLLLVLIPGVGQQINGAKRWISLAGNSLQPSEFAKLLIPIYVIQTVSRHPKGIAFKPFLRLIAIISIPMGLILIEPDNGTVAILMMTLIVLFVLLKIRAIYWVLPLCAILMLGAIYASTLSHVPGRIQIYLHPELDLQGKGHQPHQAKIAAGSGGLLGKGIGESLQKLNYLPEARSDYIAAIYAEEFGFVGVMGLIMLYMTLGGLGFTIASHAERTEAFHLVAILTFLICFQAFLNLGVVSGLLPSKGTNLPFFSLGGSSLLANCIAMGIILSVAKHVRAYR